MPSADEGAFKRLVASINPAWKEQVVAATGTATLRTRRLPAEQVIWLVLGMALYRHRPIDDLVHRLDLVLPGVDNSDHVWTLDEIARGASHEGIVFAHGYGPTTGGEAGNDSGLPPLEGDSGNRLPDEPCT